MMMLFLEKLWLHWVCLLLGYLLNPVVLLTEIINTHFYCEKTALSYLTLKLPGRGQMALPLRILAYGSQVKQKCVIGNASKFSF